MTQHLVVTAISNTPEYVTITKNNLISMNNRHVIPDQEWKNALFAYGDGLISNGDSGFTITSEEHIRAVLFIKFDTSDKKRLAKYKQLIKLMKEINGNLSDEVEAEK